MGLVWQDDPDGMRALGAAMARGMQVLHDVFARFAAVVARLLQPFRRPGRRGRL